MKINIVWGELTDNSAKKEALVVSPDMHYYEDRTKNQLSPARKWIGKQARDRVTNQRTRKMRPACKKNRTVLTLSVWLVQVQVVWSDDTSKQPCWGMHLVNRPGNKQRMSDTHSIRFSWHLVRSYTDVLCLIGLWKVGNSIYRPFFGNPKPVI